MTGPKFKFDHITTLIVSFKGYFCFLGMACRPFFTGFRLFFSGHISHQVGPHWHPNAGYLNIFILVLTMFFLPYVLQVLFPFPRTHLPTWWCQLSHQDSASFGEPSLILSCLPSVLHGGQMFFSAPAPRVEPLWKHTGHCAVIVRLSPTYDYKLFEGKMCLTHLSISKQAGNVY